MRGYLSRRKRTKNEEGFTLIEIIAVIVIMGILAAVAVPKFFSMQDEAKKAALSGALSEAAARFNHAFAQYILDNQKPPVDVANDLATADYLGTSASASPGEDIGDFHVTWSKVDPDGLLITIVSADTIADLASIPDADKTKTINVINWGTAAAPES
jgi:MSHA pilin protein MshA